MQTIDEEYIMESQDDDTELTSFSLTTILKSTNDFANDKKLGQGGFGPVYKVRLSTATSSSFYSHKRLIDFIFVKQNLIFFVQYLKYPLIFRVCLMTDEK